MEITTRIQGLPQELQDLIFEKLPPAVQDAVHYGSEEEQLTRDAQQYLKLFPFSPTKKWVKGVCAILLDMCFSQTPYWREQAIKFLAKQNYIQKNQKWCTMERYYLCEIPERLAFDLDEDEESDPCWIMCDKIYRENALNSIQRRMKGRVVNGKLIIPTDLQLLLFMSGRDPEMDQLYAHNRNDRGPADPDADFFEKISRHQAQQTQAQQTQAQQTQAQQTQAQQTSSTADSVMISINVKI